MGHKLIFVKKFRIALFGIFLTMGVCSVSLGQSWAQIYQGSFDIRGLFDPQIRLQTSLSHTLQNRHVEKAVQVLDHSSLVSFYNGRNYDPYWLTADGLTPRAKGLIEKLELSWSHGLNPDAYHLPALQKLWARSDPESLVMTDVLLTDAFIRYARDMSGMRIDTQGLRMDDQHWLRPESIETLISQLVQDQDILSFLNEIEPKGETYKTLQTELVRLSRLPHDPLDDLEPLDFGGVIFPQWKHERISDLRDRFNAPPLRGGDPDLYDDRLVAEIIKFQREKGLKPDGIIGANTLHVLNRTRQSRMRQVKANLERLRWLGEDRPERYVVVNIPSARLWAVDKGRVALEMDVIVGKPVRPTVSFVTEIDGVRLNPTWTVPPTIKRYDILPKIQEDPTYLEYKGMNLYRGYGADAVSIDPESIEWDTISRKELNDLRMVQIPGDHNPLGRVRVLMRNKYNIYLHDTNKPELFESESRAQSSGCIRLAEPEKMAHFIMQGEPGWSDQKMRDILATNRKTDLEISNPIPVYILYQTMWLDSEGQIVYGPDIYGQDRKVIEKLAAGDGLYYPAPPSGTRLAKAQ